MDHVTISIGVVRTEYQINNDASLIAYYPFDNTDTFLDRSVNMIHGIGNSITTGLLGRLQQAISFNLNTSYFEAPCYPTLRLNNLPLSISIWVNPTIVIGGGTLVHVSSLQNGNGTSCFDLLGFTATGVLVAQLKTPSPTLGSIQGIVLPLKTWTHIAVVFTSANGLRLFINGELIGVLQTTTDNNGNNYYIILGNNSPGLSVPTSACLVSTNVAGSYKGAIDEFRVYNRELDAQELCVLANI
jgi:hypothetical protein